MRAQGSDGGEAGMEEAARIQVRELRLIRLRCSAPKLAPMLGACLLWTQGRASLGVWHAQEGLFWGQLALLAGREKKPNMERSFLFAYL